MSLEGMKTSSSASQERPLTTPEQKLDGERRRKNAILLLLRKNIRTMDAGSLTEFSEDQRRKLERFLSIKGWGLDDDALDDLDNDTLYAMYDFGVSDAGSVIETQSKEALEKALRRQ